MTAQPDPNVYEVERLLEISQYKGNFFWKVRWKNYQPEDDTFEPIENLNGCVGKIEEFCENEFKSQKNDIADNLDDYITKMLPLYEKQVKEQKSKEKEEKSSQNIKQNTTKISKFPFQDELFPNKENEKKKSKAKDLNKFTFSQQKYPEFHHFSSRYLNSNMKNLLFLKPFNIPQTIINRCPKRLIENQSEPQWIKSIKKSVTYYDVLVVFNNDEDDSQKELWVPLEVAKHLCPQLVITYLLERWKANQP